MVVNSACKAARDSYTLTGGVHRARSRRRRATRQDSTRSIRSRRRSDVLRRESGDSALQREQVRVVQEVQEEEERREREGEREEELEMVTVHESPEEIEEVEEKVATPVKVVNVKPVKPAVMPATRRQPIAV